MKNKVLEELENETVKECHTCRFFHKDYYPAALGMCKRYPPSLPSLPPKQDENQLPIVALESDRHPVTWETNTCGEWKPIEE